MAAGGMNVLEIFAVALVAHGAETLLHHHLGETDDGVERGANLMADPREKIGFGRRRALGLALRPGELGFRPLPAGDVAKGDAERVGAIAEASDGHEQMERGAVAGAADNLAPAPRRAGRAVAENAVERVARRLRAFGSEQIGQGAPG